MHPAKRQKKGFVSEEDVSILLQRYSSTKVLTMLREVAQSSSGAKIDWDALVKKTATGITNAREYQMVWRHIAYRHALADKIDDGAEPMDDDSDLEYEMEASPVVSAETTAEVAACVKVLSAYGLPSEANAQNGSTVEAPLPTNIPNRQLTKSSLDNRGASPGITIALPASVPKLPTLVSPSGRGVEASDANGPGSNLPPRRKRNKWSDNEDLDLLNAVTKFGEGNWTTILKDGVFKGDRSASQLAQRWATLKKKQNGLNLGSSTSGSHISEAQLAANRAIDIAVGNGVSGSNINHPPIMNISNGEKHPSNNQASQPQKQQSQSQSQPGSGGVGGNPRPMTTLLTPKPRVPPRNPTSTSLTSTDNSMVTATAMLVGARVVHPSQAESMRKQIQSNNAIHIKSSTANTTPNPFSSTPFGAHRNVNHPTVGPARPSPLPLSSGATTSHVTGSQPVRTNQVRPIVQSTPLNLSKVAMLPTTTLSNRSNCPVPSQPSKATTSPAAMASERSNTPASTSANGHPVGNRVTGEENKTQPVLASSKTFNAEAKINPAPVLSCAEAVVTSQVLAVEKSGVGKPKDEVGSNGCSIDGMKNARNQMAADNNVCNSSQPSGGGKVSHGKDEKTVNGTTGCLLSPKDGNTSSSGLEVAKDVKAGAVKLERKEP